VSWPCAQKLARLQAVVAERVAWAEPLAQVKRLHGWLLEVEHLLDGSLLTEGEVLSNVTVGTHLDRWRERMSSQLTDGSLSQLEQECLREFLQVLSNLRSHLVQCYDREDFPRTVPRHGAQHSWPQDAVSPREWSQELECLSVALWALCSLRRLVGARCGPSPAPAPASRPT
jgi:hypothetical protein